MIDAQSSALPRRSLSTLRNTATEAGWRRRACRVVAGRRRRIAAQILGSLAPSARHPCRIGPGTESSSVRCGIFWNGRTMSLLAELLFQHTHNSTYMPALTGLRLGFKTGRNQTDQTEIKPNLTLFKPKNEINPACGGRGASRSNRKKWQRHLPKPAPKAFGVKKSALISADSPSAVLLRPSSVAELLRRQERTGLREKIGKVKQGQARVFRPPPRVPRAYRPKPRALYSKTLYFQPFCPSFHHSKLSEFTPKTRDLCAKKSPALCCNLQPLT
jgi:hypothetical protein